MQCQGLLFLSCFLNINFIKELLVLFHRSDGSCNFTCFPSDENHQGMVASKFFFGFQRFCGFYTLFL
jgi:hypothetical protein